MCLAFCSLLERVPRLPISFIILLVCVRASLRVCAIMGTIQILGMKAVNERTYWWDIVVFSIFREWPPVFLRSSRRNLSCVQFPPKSSVLKAAAPSVRWLINCQIMCWRVLTQERESLCHLGKKEKNNTALLVTMREWTERDSNIIHRGGRKPQKMYVLRTRLI